MTTVYYDLWWPYHNISFCPNRWIQLNQLDKDFLKTKKLEYLSQMLIHWWIQGGVRDVSPPQSNFFCFRAVFLAKILSSNRFTHLPLSPRSGKSWISYCHLTCCSGGYRISQTGRRQAQKAGGGPKPINWPNCAENCKKMKKMRGGMHQKFYYVDLPLQWDLWWIRRIQADDRDTPLSVQFPSLPLATIFVGR